MNILHIKFKKSILTTSMALLLAGCAQQAVPPSPSKHPVKVARSKAVPHGFTQVGRYITVNNVPSNAQVNPLLAVATFHFGPHVSTVGDAIAQVLRYTGYQLVKDISPQVKQTLAKPLPVTDRTLGPMRIQQVLIVLMGAEVYELQRDPLHRLVNFQVKPTIAQALGV